jgi:RNA polymerase sigma-70 factor (ECF subfamily)
MLEIKDEQLIEDYLQGNEGAFKLLTERYFKLIYNFIWRYLGDASAAEDVTQEVFLRAWKNLKKFDKKKSFKTWLYSIAKNAALDWLKKKKAIPMSQLENAEGDNAVLDSLADESPLPDEILARKDLAKILTVALDKLTPKHREVLLLYYQNQLNLVEIAEVLSEPINTVKSRHRRALIALKVHLKDL